MLLLARGYKADSAINTDLDQSEGTAHNSEENLRGNEAVAQIHLQQAQRDNTQGYEHDLFVAHARNKAREGEADDGNRHVFEEFERARVHLSNAIIIDAFQDDNPDAIQKDGKDKEVDVQCPFKRFIHGQRR